MKTIQFLCCIIFISLGATAQIQKGDHFLAGGISGYSTKNEITASGSGNSNEYKVSNWRLDASYGHYFSSRIAVGLTAGFGLTNSKTQNANPSGSEIKFESSLFTAGPFLRYSKSVADKFSCFVHVYGKYGTGSVSSTAYGLTGEPFENKGTQSLFGGGITGGFNYFLSDKFALAIMYGDLGYESTETKYDDSPAASDNTSSTLRLNLGLSSLSLGMQYFIRCKKD